MRSGRSFLVLLVLAAGLGAYIYFVEAKRDSSAPAAKAKVFGASAGLIDEVEVRAESGAITKVKRDGSSWQITEPAGVEGDTAQIATLVTTLDSLEVERVVDENPTAVAAYGLDPPRFSVAFRKEGETAQRRLQVGGKTPTGGDVYARVEGDPKVILIAAYLENSLNRTTFDLRNKAVLKFDRGGVDALRLESTGQPDRAMEKRGETWRLTAPATARADFGAVDGLVQQLSQLQMEALINEDGTDSLKTYGLDRPRASVTVGVGSTRATLALGARIDDGTAVYARDLSRPAIFTVETAVEEELKKTVDALRLKELFAFRSFNAVALDVSWNKQAATFAKVASPPPPPPADASPAPAAPVGPEVWKRTAPEAADVDQAQMTDLLSGLSNLRAESFTDRPLASGDELVVVARFGDPGAPTEERVTFRKSGSVVHATIAGESGAAVVSLSDFDAAVAKLKELAGLK